MHIFYLKKCISVYLNIRYVIYYYVLCKSRIFGRKSNLFTLFMSNEIQITQAPLYNVIFISQPFNEKFEFCNEKI